MMKAVFLALVVATTAGAARADSGCLQVGRIWSWRPLDKRNLIVEDELHQKYKVGFAGFCPALPYKLSLGFKSNGAVSGLDCLRRGDEVISRDIGIPYTCPVMSVTPYTPAMERADPAAAAAKQQ